MATYAYTRVSTNRQADEGESLGVQERQIAGYALMHGMTVAETFVEGGVSGSVPLADRHQGQRLLAALKPGDTLITAKMDRMFRSSRDALNTLETLRQQRVSLHMIDLGGDVTGNGISKLVFTILSAVAESERDRIRERIQTVKRDQQSRGKYLGGKIPYGYTLVDGELIEQPEQQAAIAEARRLRASGMALRTIRDTMGLTVSLDALARLTRQ